MIKVMADGEDGVQESRNTRITLRPTWAGLIRQFVTRLSADDRKKLGGGGQARKTPGNFLITYITSFSRLCIHPGREDHVPRQIHAQINSEN